MRTLIMIVSMLILSAGGFAQTTWNVPGDFSKIQDALNNASVLEGDTILVGPGTYYENVEFGGKDVTLKSTDGPAATIIDGNGVFSVVAFMADNGPGSVLDGFTITNGLGCDPYNGNGGGGILCRAGSDPVLINNIITQNTATGSGGGIYTAKNCSVTISGNVISENSAIKAGGIFGANFGCYLTIRGNVIMNNKADTYGGGIKFDKYAEAIISDNLIMGNEAASYGGGINASQSRLILANNAIVNNSVTDPAGVGGGVYLHLHANTLLTSNTITGNQASDGSGIYNGQFSPIIMNSIIWGNTGTQVSYQSDPPIITYSNVQGGWAGTGNIDADPLFVSGPEGDYYLSQISAGQAADSPCIDTGRTLAYNLNLHACWTSTNEVPDTGVADMGIHHGPYAVHSLTTEAYEISDSTGGSIQFDLDAGPFPPTVNFLLCGSISGTSPGTALPPGNVTLPLNWDVFTTLTINLANTFVFQNFLGTLNSYGMATATLNLPPDTGAAGLTLYFAYALGLPFDFVSNPVMVNIVP